MTVRRLLDESPPAPVQPPLRLGRALSLSLSTHIAGAIVLTLFVSGRTAPVTSSAEQAMPRSIIWMPRSGPAGGADGGGDKTPKARPAQAKGPGVVAVPVQPPTEIRPTSEPREADVNKMIAPLQPATAGLENLVGVLEPVAIGSPDTRGPGTGINAGPGTSDKPGSGETDGVGDGPPGSGGIVPPQLLRQVPPKYTDDAMRAKIQGLVTVEAVVLSDGSVGEVKVVRSLDATFGLDREAIVAVKMWRFMPGTRFGKPVPMLVTVELTFTLR